MKLDEFQIGSRFQCGERRWLCTDVGTRTAVAVCLTVADVNDWARALPKKQQLCPGEDLESSWLRGPPYAIQEYVFDEHDMMACALVERP